jgi:NAD(P)-dependent dehydrogenase (short-subunit alcohol dehydrogenase family)
MEPMKNNVIIITGASSGLGRSLALDAGRRGARVGILARRAYLLEEIKDTIISAGGQCVALPTDVGDPDSVSAAFARIDSTFGRVDILFNCAAVVEPVSPLSEAPVESLLTALKTNVFGIYLTTRQVLPRMQNQNGLGTIINITSGAGSNPYAGWSAYCSQKAAVDMLTRCVALEVADMPIRVAAISPGPFESSMQQIIRKAEIKAFPARDKFVKLHREGRLADPETFAKIILDISLADWPELSGIVADLRADDFQIECRKRGIEIAF